MTHSTRVNRDSLYAYSCPTLMYGLENLLVDVCVEDDHNRPDSGS